MRLLMLLFVIAPLFVPSAHAHTRSQSFSTWTVQGKVLQGVYQVDAYRVTQLSETPQNLLALLTGHLAETVFLTQEGKTCSQRPVLPLHASRGEFRVELRFECPKPFSVVDAHLEMNAFFGVSISHVHYARLDYGQGRVDEIILTQGQSALLVGNSKAGATHSVLSFLSLGFKHVLSGLDHLAFLLALVMLSGSAKRTVLAVTGFTIGHSVTLALVTLGILRPDIATVESLIGFTVAWAAGDALARARGLPEWWGLVGTGGILLLPLFAALMGTPQLSWLVFFGLALFAASMSYARQFDSGRVAPLIATVFGLAHGAGFAGPLLELKIVPGDLFWTLLAFNVGVELGQLSALAVLALGLWLILRTKVSVPQFSYDVVASLLFALGTFWFVSRALA